MSSTALPSVEWGPTGVSIHMYIFLMSKSLSKSSICIHFLLTISCGNSVSRFIHMVMLITVVDPVCVWRWERGWQGEGALGA